MRNLFQCLLESHELVRKQAVGPWRKLLLTNLAEWAASGYVFAARYRGHVAAIGVAGPVTADTLNDKGSELMPEDFDKRGERLYCAYALVDKKVRGRTGMVLMAEMTKVARDSFSGCRSLVYARALRGDTRLREKPFKKTLIEQTVEEDNGVE